MSVVIDRRAALASFGVGAAVSALSGCVSSTAAKRIPDAQGKLYVTSWFGGAIHVVDLARGEAVRTIPVGVHNHNVFLSPDKKAAWVANNNNGTVSVIDTSKDSVIATISVGAGPRHTYFSPDGAIAYVTLEFENAIAEVDVATHAVRRKLAVGHMPHFPIVVGDRLYVTNFGGASVAVIDRASGSMAGHIPTGIGPLGAGATRDGHFVLVACHNANEVAVIDVAAGKLDGVVKTDAGPVQVTVTPDQQSAYVANDGAGTVQKIDLASRKVISTIPIGSTAGSHGVAFSAAHGLLFITNTGRGTVSAIDMVREEIVGEYAVGPAPEGIAVLPQSA